ncbi:MAG: type II toxin-antitoxin system RelE/ParE family toxin [Candidatus Aminicenantales bacterium]
MGYDVIWHEKALKDLKGLDKNAARTLIGKIKTQLAVNPMALGKPLRGIFKGLCRYRHSDYRIIYALDRAEKKIIILHIKHCFFS